MAKKRPYRATKKDFLRVLKPFKNKLMGMLLEGEKIRVTINGTNKRLQVAIKIKDED